MRFIFLLALLFQFPAEAHAQSLPPAKVLLARMEAAMQRAGSAHATISSRQVPTAVHDTLSGFLDISTAQHEVHLLVTHTVRAGAATVTDRAEFVAAQGKFGEYVEGIWTCSPITPDVAQYLFSYPQDLVGRVMVQEKTVRAGTVRGIPVWWVRILPNPVHSTLGPIRLAIAQGTDLLVRETEKFGLATPREGALTEIYNFSRYGERFTVHLPAVCNTQR